MEINSCQELGHLEQPIKFQSTTTSEVHDQFEGQQGNYHESAQVNKQESAQGKNKESAQLMYDSLASMRQSRKACPSIV